MRLIAKRQTKSLAGLDDISLHKGDKNFERLVTLLGALKEAGILTDADETDAVSTVNAVKTRVRHFQIFHPPAPLYFWAAVFGACGSAPQPTLRVGSGAWLLRLGDAQTVEVPGSQIVRELERSPEK